MENQGQKFEFFMIDLLFIGRAYKAFKLNKMLNQIAGVMDYVGMTVQTCALTGEELDTQELIEEVVAILLSDQVYISNLYYYAMERMMPYTLYNEFSTPDQHIAITPEKIKEYEENHLVNIPDELFLN